MAFLVFEGIDGSGKSGLLARLCKRFQEEGLAFVKTKEPGGTRNGVKIREILLEKQNLNLEALTEVLLYYADRKQHVEELIKPNLEKGLWVLSDRYWASTSAYQCGGRGIDESFIQSLKQKVCQNIEPDLWILLDLPIEDSLKRLFISKKDKRDRLEMEDSAFHQRVRDYYLKLAKREPHKWLILPATKKPQELLEQVLSHLKQINLLKP